MSSLSSYGHTGLTVIPPWLEQAHTYHPPSFTDYITCDIPIKHPFWQLQVSINGDTLKWLVYKRKSQSEMDDLGVPPFVETPN